MTGQLRVVDYSKAEKEDPVEQEFKWSAIAPFREVYECNELFDLMVILNPFRRGQSRASQLE